MYTSETAMKIARTIFILQTTIIVITIIIFLNMMFKLNVHYTADFGVVWEVIKSLATDINLPSNFDNLELIQLLGTVSGLSQFAIWILQYAFWYAFGWPK